MAPLDLRAANGEPERSSPSDKPVHVSTAIGEALASIAASTRSDDTDPEPIVEIDTREQVPLPFSERVRVVRHALDTGDDANRVASRPTAFTWARQEMTMDPFARALETGVMRATAVLNTLAFSLSLCGTAAAGREAYSHDGFYLRLGGGLGYMLGKDEPERGTGGADVKGLAFSTEVALGGTPAPGLVVGGGSYASLVPSPTYSFEGGAELDAGAHQLSSIGPFVDYYLDPRGGVHLQAALLLSAVAVEKKGGGASTLRFGFGAMVGAGYETWVGKQWSIGPVLRLTVHELSIAADDEDANGTLRALVPSLLFGATWQ